MFKENQRLFAKVDILNQFRPDAEPIKVASAGKELVFVRELPENIGERRIMVRHPHNHIPIFATAEEVTIDTPEGFEEPVVEVPEDIYQVGKTVYLNSGSPALEILEVNGDEIKTTWINEAGLPDTLTGPKACFCASLNQTVPPTALGGDVPADQH